MDPEIREAGKNVSLMAVACDPGTLVVFSLSSAPCSRRQSMRNTNTTQLMAQLQAAGVEMNPAVGTTSRLFLTDPPGCLAALLQGCQGRVASSYLIACILYLDKEHLHTVHTLAAAKKAG